MSHQNHSPEKQKSKHSPFAAVSDTSTSSESPSQSSDGNALWGGRFGAGPSAIMAEINASIDTDRHLYREDIAGSRAHARMLAATDIISTKDCDRILAGLDQIEQEIAQGHMVFDKALEDIHMHVEKRLIDLIGEAGRRLHTARSRNDQVATDFKLYTRRLLRQMVSAVEGLQLALLDQAERTYDWVMPGFTHLQTAQPVTMGHHLLAYVEMLSRDKGRMEDAVVRLNESPLGSAALAGTGFPIDRFMTAKELGFDRPTANSLDAVSARDFALEALAALSILAMHLSRLADEIILWANPSFGFLTLSDSYSTGSSIMPQKRNPDAAELVRAKVGGMAGRFTQLLMVLKGLPLAYSKDMQEDKAPLIAAFEDMDLCLAAMTGMMADFKPVKKALEAACEKGFITATDLADWLVRDLNLPFRDAHHITGQLVKLAEKKQVDLSGLSLEDMQGVEPRITNAIYAVLTVSQSVNSRKSYGGTAPSNVKASIDVWRRHFEEKIS